MAKEHFKKLQSASEQLLNLISKLERRLFAIPETTFNENENRPKAED
jgi:metal-dependent amidase/aminoacylase/carboxypeptidase family protein